MSALLEFNPRIGSTLPRIYTPTLPQHADPEAEYGIKPDATWGPLCCQFLEELLGWELLPWQKWLYHHALEKRPDNTGFRFRLLLVLVGRQQGKALDIETPILTRTGWKQMGDVEIGDEVFHPDGHHTRVIGAFDPMFEHRCYEVITTDGRKVVADADHLWTVQDRRRKFRKGRRGEKPVQTYAWETLTTTELIERGVTGARPKDFSYRLPAQQQIISKPVELPINPYVLGIWLGDGASNASIIHVGDQDVEELKMHLTVAGAEVINAKRYRTCWNISFGGTGAGTRNAFKAAAQQLGVWGNKHIPDLYLTAGTEQRAALLAGLLDTDGHCAATDGQVEFCSTKEELADGVLYLARSLGYRATKTAGRATLAARDCGPKYRVRFTPSTAPFRLARKNARVRPIVGDRTAISIRSITEVGSRPVRCIKVDRPDGLFLAGRDLMPTHNTTWGRGLGLWRLFMDQQGRPDPLWPAAKLAVVAAQNLEYAEQTLKEVVDCIRDHPLLATELINHAVTNGKHRAILTNRRLWRAATASRKGGRSLPVDFAWLDEIREHTTHDAFRAIEPTTTVRPCSQLLATSNAGDARSIVLRALRDSAMRNVTTGRTSETRTGFFEWSVPEDVDPRDPAYWHLALPAMGLLNDFCLEDVLGKFEAMEAGDMPGFQTEYLCQWIASLQPGIIPAQAWMDTLDRTSCIGEGEPVYACVDVNYHRTRAYVGLAGRRSDGDIHIEVPPGEPRGVDWIADYLLTRKDHIAGVCIQRAGAPASSLTLDLRAAGIDIIDWGNPVTQLSDGAAAFFDGIVDGVIKHRPAPVLDRAAASTVAANAKDSWFFSRRNSPVDAAPLVACCGAAWLLNNPPPTIGPPTVWEWPDDDTLDEWRKETDERFS